MGLSSVDQVLTQILRSSHPPSPSGPKQTEQYLQLANLISDMCPQLGRSLAVKYLKELQASEEIVQQVATNTLKPREWSPRIIKLVSATRRDSNIKVSALLDDWRLSGEDWKELGEYLAMKMEKPQDRADCLARIYPKFKESCLDLRFNSQACLNFKVHTPNNYLDIENLNQVCGRAGIHFSLSKQYFVDENFINSCAGILSSPEGSSLKEIEIALDSDQKNLYHILMNAIQQNSSLETLHLSGGLKLGEREFRKIRKVVAQHPSLTHLHLKYDIDKSADCNTIIEALKGAKKGLRSLSLQGDAPLREAMMRVFDFDFYVPPPASYPELIRLQPLALRQDSDDESMTLD